MFLLLFPQVVVVALTQRLMLWEVGPGLGGSSPTHKGENVLLLFGNKFFFIRFKAVSA